MDVMPPPRIRTEAPRSVLRRRGDECGSAMRAIFCSYRGYAAEGCVTRSRLLRRPRPPAAAALPCAPLCRLRGTKWPRTGLRPARARPRNGTGRARRLVCVGREQDGSRRSAILSRSSCIPGRAPSRSERALSSWARREDRRLVPWSCCTPASLDRLQQPVPPTSQSASRASSATSVSFCGISTSPSPLPPEDRSRTGRLPKHELSPSVRDGRSRPGGVEVSRREVPVATHRAVAS